MKAAPKTRTHEGPPLLWHGYGYICAKDAVVAEKCRVQVETAMATLGYSGTIFIDLGRLGEQFHALLRRIQDPNTAAPVFVSHASQLYGRFDLVRLYARIWIMTAARWIEHSPAPHVVVSTR